MAADPQHYREVFARFPTGVAVVTGAGPAGASGMTANAVCSLSLQPPLALVCFDNRARTLPLVRAAGRFAINVLASDQRHLARVFASKEPEERKLDGVSYRIEQGVPVLEGAVAWVACELLELLPRGDHTIAIGEVAALDGDEREPLLFHRGDFRAIG